MDGGGAGTALLYTLLGIGTYNTSILCSVVSIVENTALYSVVSVQESTVECEGGTLAPEDGVSQHPGQTPPCTILHITLVQAVNHSKL